MIEGLFLGGGAALVLAAAAAITGNRGGRRRVALGLVIAGAFSLIAASGIVLAENSDLTFQLHQVTPQLGISFHLDRLAAFFILIISSVAACVAVYSLRYVEHTGSQSRRDMSVAAMSVFILSMVLVVASANFFAFIFFWELMSLSSLFLVMFDREKAETAKAGIYYLVMTQFSTLFLLLGALLLHRYTGTFDITSAGGLTLSTAGIILVIIP
ncbi:proton-conducting transporter membrane subunit [Dehalogenimonas etheniformans]|uniref:proton-conducting transporter transmembrane domain-containing protein n=1 Tax=Dehalogenimonas etheniformans TaxID=1536648 RepID=UPI0037483F1C